LDTTDLKTCEAAGITEENTTDGIEASAVPVTTIADLAAGGKGISTMGNYAS
jgi:hypothetical protein